MDKKEQRNPRIVDIIEIICPAHGRTTLLSYAMGFSFECGCEWEPRWTDKRGDYWEQTISGNSNKESMSQREAESEQEKAKRILKKVSNNVGAALRLPLDDSDTLDDVDLITGDEMDLIRALLRPVANGDIK
jgi:hypothetical protein